jgi:hypothetical protein
VSFAVSSAENGFDGVCPDRSRQQDKFKSPFTILPTLLPDTPKQWRQFNIQSLKCGLRLCQAAIARAAGQFNFAEQFAERQTGVQLQQIAAPSYSRCLLTADRTAE